MHRFRPPALSVLAMLILAGCSSAGPSAELPGTTRGGELGRIFSSKDATVFVSSQPFSGDAAVYGYAGNGDDPPVSEQISDGLTTPGGIDVNENGKLYVANSTGGTGGNGFVVVYPTNATSPTTTYTTGLFAPNNVLVGSDGRVYVAQDESVVEFPPGKTTPDRAIYTGPGTTATGLALDAASNLYVAFYTLKSGNVEVVPPGQEEGAKLNLGLRHPIGIAVDSSKNLIVSDSSLGQSAIDVFPPGAKKPTMKITQNLILSQYVRLAQRDSRLYVADADAHAVFEYTYPVVKLVRTISSDLVRAYGVAVIGGK
jgi:hypothetical protein